MTVVEISRRILPAITLACALGLIVPAMAQTTPPPGSGVAPVPTPGATTVAPATSGKTTATSAGTVSSTTATPVSPKPAANSGAKLPAGDKFTTVALAAAHCPGDTVVWSALTKGRSYHLSTSKYYGKTKHGAYVCEKDAAAAGYHASKE